MNRLIFLNRYFYPDYSATSQILTGLAFHLASVGRPVHIITSQQRYDDPEARLPAEEVVQGVHVHRISSTRFGRSSLLGRAFDYLSFYPAAWHALVRIAAQDDIVIAKTDPPLLSIITHFAVPHVRQINWLQDLYPEVAIESGIPLLKGPFGFVLSRLRDASLKAAAGNVVVGQQMAQKLRARNVERVHVIHNWAPDAGIVPVAHTENRLRHSWKLENKFVIGYSGNLGRAHEFETVLGAVSRLREHPRIVFTFIGGGHGARNLKKLVIERGLDGMFYFLPYQKEALLKYSLGAADVHWISLRPEFEGLIVPSKFYGVAAAGRPIIAITDRHGEVARLVEEYQCGIVVEPGDCKRLASELIDLADNPDRVAAMGARARAMVEARFTRAHAFAQWMRVLDSIEKET